MKVKSLITLALSAFAAASLAYGEPAMKLADDTAGQMPSADQSATQSQDQNGASTDATGGSAGAGATAGASDEGSSDTATGDDDY